MSHRFLLQGVSDDNHAEAIAHMLSLTDLRRALFGVAFLRSRGVRLISEHVTSNADRITIVTGIRNGITSAQGLQAAIELGCATYVVDTGAISPIYHPKVYLARSATRARVLVGSANLTSGGLRANIEGSLLLSLELEDRSSERLIRDIEGKFDDMINDYPVHVREVTSSDEIEALLSSGRVTDEESAPPPTSIAESKGDPSGLLPRMDLKATVVRTQHPRQPVLPSQTRPSGSESQAVPKRHLEQVWITGPLSRRDLNIPTGPTTNPTGSILLKKGALPEIDQFTYFRNDVFSKLDWEPDSRPSRNHIERATAQVQIIVSGIDYGTFQLSVSHNTDTASPTYAQGNSPTSLHWDAARPLVANEHLLGRVARLFRHNSREGYFTLQID